MSRKIIVIIMAVAVISFIPVTCLADVNVQGIIQPNWTYIETYLNYFDISSTGKATVEVILEAHNTDELKIQANLQQYKNGRWTTIKNWSKTSEDIYCAMEEAWYVVSGYSYRLVSTGTAYKNGVKVEQTTYTSEEHEY